MPKWFRKREKETIEMGFNKKLMEVRVFIDGEEIPNVNNINIGTSAIPQGFKMKYAVHIDITTGEG